MVWSLHIRGAGLLLAVTLLASCGGQQGQQAGTDSAADDGALAGLLAAPIAEAQAVRFLWKSSFGPTTESIARLRQLGYARFVDEQLALPSGRYNDYMLRFYKLNREDLLNAYCAGFVSENPSTCWHWIYADNRAPSVVFFKSAVHDSDQLRLRMAWALSQILVVSSNFTDKHSAGMRMYQQLLRDNGLANYRDLLLKITKDPLMANWLDLAGSDPANPNQNYARELLQLFSVGTYQRRPDGTFVTNEEGKRLENYTQSDVLSFSRALTGWGYAPEVVYQNPRLPNNESPMQANLPHDRTAKTLLNGVSIPTGKTADQELEVVVDNVFAHPSTGPNIARQLIQLLVTSNPSPAYVARVVRVWNNNGMGVAGDLKAVARAILLDSEALNPPDVGGRLLEPVIALTGLVRGIGGSTDGAALDLAAQAMQQRPFAAPSVFNFYPPDYILPLQGPRRHAPQFGIVSLSTVAARVNAAHSLIFSNTIARDGNLPLGVTSGTALQWPLAWQTMATNQVPALVDVLNTRLAGGVLESAQRNHIVAQVQALPGDTSAQRLQRLRLAAFLVFSSPQFMAHR